MIELNIIKGSGIGPIKFGLKKEAIENILGKPSETEKETHEEEEVEFWHYDDYEMTLSFDEAADWKLTAISFSDDRCRIEGHPLMGLNRKTLLETLDNLPVKSLQFDEVSDQDLTALSIIHAEDWGLALVLENDSVTEVQLEPLYYDEETIMWPE